MLALASWLRVRTVLQPYSEQESCMDVLKACMIDFILTF